MGAGRRGDVMTAVLRTLRDLEAAHRRGEITEVELAFGREALMGSVEEAEIIDAEAVEIPPKPDDTPSDTARDPDILVTAFGAVSICVILGGLTALMVEDILLGTTLGIALLAAVIVHLFLKTGP